MNGCRVCGRPGKLDEEGLCSNHSLVRVDDDDREDGPGWCDRCSPGPCTCDDGPDDLSDLGPLDEDGLIP